jgi:hypothetical protein
MSAVTVKVLPSGVLASMLSSPVSGSIVAPASAGSTL